MKIVYIVPNYFRWCQRERSNKLSGYFRMWVYWYTQPRVPATFSSANSLNTGSWRRRQKFGKWRWSNSELNRWVSKQKWPLWSHRLCLKNAFNSKMIIENIRDLWEIPVIKDALHDSPFFLAYHMKLRGFYKKRFFLIRPTLNESLELRC